MDKPTVTKNTQAFYVQAWISFGLALFAIVVGVIYMDLDPWIRGFLAVTACWLVTSCFTLAKVIRDQQESTAVFHRLDQARVDKILAEHDPFRAVS